MSPQLTSASARPIAPAWQRRLLVPSDVDPSLDCPGIESAWTLSARTLTQIADELQRADLPSQIRTVFVTGSMARMEQQAGSDFDLIVVVKDSATEPMLRELWGQVWEVLERSGLERPVSNGIYSVAGRWSAFGRRDTLGEVSEPVVEYGHRIQLLLESQPVYNVEEYRALVSETLNRFLASPAHSNTMELQVSSEYLIREACRYYQSLWIRSRWIADPHRHAMINFKLRFSRMLAYAGLIALAGRADQSELSVAAEIAHRISLTPLERLISLTSPEQGRGQRTESNRATAQELMKAADHCLAVLESTREMTNAKDRTDRFHTSGPRLEALVECVRAIFICDAESWSRLPLQALVF